MDDGIEGADWKKNPPPIKRRRVMCSTTKCDDDLHFFKTNRRTKAGKAKKTYRNGECVRCGKHLIDWKRIDRWDASDMDFIIDSLKKEYVRHRYWNMPVKKSDVKKAENSGLTQLEKEVRKRIEKSISAPKELNAWDGRQTPAEGNIIFYAQHATATCCRTCIEEWYDVPINMPLDDKHSDFFTNLIMTYIRRKIPALQRGVNRF